LNEIAYIEIEINSLEDAYINFVKEEEKSFIEINKTVNLLKNSLDYKKRDTIND
jgi:hypothetical protein